MRKTYTVELIMATLAIVLMASVSRAQVAQHLVQPRIEPRPFEHRLHESVSCTSCHGSGERHRSILVRSPRDCANCHHDAQRVNRTCASCHPSPRQPATLAIPARMTFSVKDSAIRRTLPFEHNRHVEAGINCQACHRTPVTMAVNRDCASCHEPHHRAEATCTSCHTPAPRGVHKASVHLSCSGSGCHATNVAPVPTASRSVCLSCHVRQRDHEPGRNCAVCHGIPSGLQRAGGGRSGLQ